MGHKSIFDFFFFLHSRYGFYSDEIVHPAVPTLKAVLKITLVKYYYTSVQNFINIEPIPTLVEEKNQFIPPNFFLE